MIVSNNTNIYVKNYITKENIILNDENYKVITDSSFIFRNEKTLKEIITKGIIQYKENLYLLFYFFDNEQDLFIISCVDFEKNGFKEEIKIPTNVLMLKGYKIYVLEESPYSKNACLHEYMIFNKEDLKPINIDNILYIKKYIEFYNVNIANKKIMKHIIKILEGDNIFNENLTIDILDKKLLNKVYREINKDMKLEPSNENQQKILNLFKDEENYNIYDLRTELAFNYSHLLDDNNYKKVVFYKIPEILKLEDKSILFSTCYNSKVDNINKYLNELE